MGEAGEPSRHVVQPPQPRAHPLPCAEGFAIWGRGLGGEREAGGGGSCPRALVLKWARRCLAPGSGAAKTMAFMVKTIVGGQLKDLTGSLGGGEDKGDGDKSAAQAQGMSREEYEEYQKQLVEEK